MSAETARVLRKAKKRLTGRWGRGSWAMSPDGQPLYGPITSTRSGESRNTCHVCALGAVTWAVVGDPTKRFRIFMDARQERLYDGAIRALTDALPRTSRSVDSFNDWSRRKEGDVLDLFDRAIAAEEAS